MAQGVSHRPVSAEAAAANPTQPMGGL